MEPPDKMITRKSKKGEEGNERKMKPEDINSLMQLIESMNLAVNELEKSMENRDIEKVKRAKQEILSLQKEVDKILS